MGATKNIIAHRGIPALSHENTIESFDKAIRFGADFIEFDIRRTADGVLVAFHNPSIQHYFSRISLQELTFTDLQSIAKRKGFIVPTVKEIFERFSGKVGFDIEFKEENCEEETIDMINSLHCKQDCFVTSFNETVVKKVQSVWPEIPVGLLIQDQTVIENTPLTDYRMLCPSKEIFQKNRNFFVNWKQAERYIAIWTVDSTALLEMLLKDDIVNSIITNRCDIAVTLRKQLQ